MSKRTIRILLLLAVACTALLVVAATGSARSGGDRNGDRIPDRWERAHHLSLKVNQAKRDQDHDGLRNRAEFLAGTDPRNDDSDDDGIEDGAEGAGTVTSFTGGVLTIHLFNGDDVKGTVDSRTEIECEHRGSASTTAVAAHDGGDDPGGDDDDGDDNGEHDQGDDNGGDDANGCDDGALTAGAVVREAELETTSAGLVFHEIEIVG
jgi:hypothetical protein